MGIIIIFVLCCFVVGTAQDEVTLEPDMPFLSVRLSGKVHLKCCFNNNGKPVKYTWVRSFRSGNKTLGPHDVKNANGESPKQSGKVCCNLTLSSVTLNDSGLYQCWLNGSNVNLFTHGTYLQVYKSLDKTINLSENTKNKILTAEGILLLLCVLLPSATVLFKSKRISELEKKKLRKEEENIYQGLNLDECCTTYDQIERSRGHGPYQDVCNITEEEEIQLEKP